MAGTSLEQQSATPTTAAHPVPRYNPDAPSEEWGWHGSWREFAPRGSSILLWAGVILLLLQNFTTHESNVEAYYYNGLAALGVIWLVQRHRSSRRLRRRSHHD